MIDPTFRDISRLYVSSFKNGENDPTRNSFVKYYTSLVEIKDCNVLINNKLLFDQPVKTNKKRMKQLPKCEEAIAIQLEALLNCLIHQKRYKLVGIDLSRQANISIPQQIKFIGKLENDDGAAMFFYC